MSKRRGRIELTLLFGALSPASLGVGFVDFPARTVITWDRYGVEAGRKSGVSLDRLTASLDAALTLVPDGFVVNLGSDRQSGLVWIDNDPTSRGGGTTMASHSAQLPTPRKDRHALKPKPLISTRSPTQKSCRLRNNQYIAAGKNKFYHLA